MKIVDLRGTLPFEDNVFGTYGPKTSRTFHWNGGLAGLDPIPQLIADANLHISKGWGGISYHKAIGLDGTLYLCRDDDAVLAAVANADGNEHSEMIQFMLGRSEDGLQVQHPTAAMWATANELASAAPGGVVWGHRDWSATECPGAEVYAWIQSRIWEDTMTPAQEAKLDAILAEVPKIDRLLALLEAREPLVWIARSQRGLDVERGKPYDPTVPPADTRIKA